MGDAHRFDAHRSIDARRSEIRERLAEVERRLAQLRIARSEWTDEEHDPEGFTLTHEWSRLEGSRADYAAELIELDRAESRLAAGAYGICAVCGLPIPPAQL
ncbi:MAG TPA: molecular chaperone DnaK, partial [Pseudolysinimonas sp.]|nr:molecular chaperone DnaK [Pseudolysinimonas sp.]